MDSPEATCRARLIANPSARCHHAGSMKRLEIRQATGKQHQLQVIGWKTPKENFCRECFYALDQAGKPLVITLRLPLPKSYTGGQGGVALSCEPFTEAVCVEIAPCRLLPPPCYRSHDEYKRQLYAEPVFEPWKPIYRKNHQPSKLILEPSDDKALQKELDSWLKKARAAYEHERGLWLKEIQRLETQPLGKLRLASEEARKKHLAEAQGQLATVESETPIEYGCCKGNLKLTLDRVKSNGHGIRDRWLQTKWAQETGEDLLAMHRERRAFYRWLREHTGTNSYVLNKGHNEVIPPDFGERFEDRPEFMEACAHVCYRARFADGKTVYLAGCELREELTVPELDEVAKLRLPLESPPLQLRHSENFRQLFWMEDGKEIQANLTKDQAAAFSALFHAQNNVLAREELRQEIYGGSPPKNFRPDKLFAYRDGRKVWKRFIRVERGRFRLALKSD